MTARKLSRREALAGTGLLAGAAVLGHPSELSAAPATPPHPAPDRPFRYCLNTATIRAFKLGIVKEIEIAAQAGYQAIEPWVEAVETYVQNGGALKDLRQRIIDSGLTVEGAISFAEWLVDDDARRAKGLERAKHEMDIMAQIGGRRIAAPPNGARDLPKVDLLQAAERYHALLEAGARIGIVPEIEVWGFSKNLGRLSECVAVAVETGHRNACVLADVYHLYKGGSDFHGMRLLGPETIQVLHMNDYPSDPPRDRINDSYRVYPGDGVAPLTDILQTLHRTGGQKVLSLELFNPNLAPDGPLALAKTGLAKMKAVVARTPL